MALLAPAIPLAVEGLTTVVTLASAGVAAWMLGKAAAEVAPRVAEVVRPTYRDGHNSSGPSRQPQRPSPPELPPDESGVIIAALLADMMARYLEKGGQVDAPLVASQVDGPLVYDSLLDADMRLKDKHEWSGHFKRGPPQNVRKYDEREEPKKDLVHQGAPPQGSKAGLAYACGGTQWIVAWHAPLNSDPKIHVECGPNLPIDWSKIERALDASGKNQSSCKGAGAKIKRDSKNRAVISVVFRTS